MATDFSKMNIEKFFDTLAKILSDKYDVEIKINIEKKNFEIKEEE